MDLQGLARDSHGLASISNGPASTESVLQFTQVLSALTCLLLAFARDFKWFRLKPMHCPAVYVVQVLKPMLFATTKEARGVSKVPQFVQTHAPVRKR